MTDELNRLLEVVRPDKRNPHPCVTRCWRVGGPVDLDERGVCQECGVPTDINTSPTCELPRPLVIALVECARAADEMRESATAIAPRVALGCRRNGATRTPRPTSPR